MSVLIKGMKMPEKCGSCDLFHVESPMHCTVVKGHKTVGAPYGMPRPDWCPLIEIHEPQEGHWIRTDCGLDVECKCSVCGYKDFVEPHDTYWFKRNYCPNCGARMKGERQK